MENHVWKIFTGGNKISKKYTGGWFIKESINYKVKDLCSKELFKRQQ